LVLDKTTEIHRCRNLLTLAALPNIAPNFEYLVVDTCGKVSGGEIVVKKLPNLVHSFVQDTVMIKDGKLDP